MDIIEITRELGRAIQPDECYSRYLLAKDANDKDEELQNLIGEFNLKRIAINSENSKADKDQARLEHLNAVSYTHLDVYKRQVLAFWPKKSPTNWAGA